jgi:hypothetical protein
MNKIMIIHFFLLRSWCLIFFRWFIPTSYLSPYCHCFLPKIPPTFFRFFYKKVPCSFSFLHVCSTMAFTTKTWSLKSLIPFCMLHNRNQFTQGAVFFVLFKSSLVGRDFRFMNEYLCFNSMALASTLSLLTTNTCHIIWTPIRKCEPVHESKNHVHSRQFLQFADVGWLIYVPVWRTTFCVTTSITQAPRYNKFNENHKVR